MKIQHISFTAFTDQRPGTSGLRKSVTHFQQPHYTQSFIQAIFTTLGCEGKTIVIGGDGRFYNDKAIQIIIKMAIAQKAKHLIIGENGLFSTPAASHIIRHYHADYGIILSASHNPGGPNADFGIKFNLNAGQPAPEKATEAVFATSKTLNSYTIAEMDDLSLTLGSSHIAETKIDVISATKDYADLMESLFDFGEIRAFLAKNPIVFDAMHAATGPYAQEIFHHRLGLAEQYLLNTTALPDFGGGHPDPQPSHAQDLYAGMKRFPEAVMGAASDGDGDRNLILGHEHLINPCDSLAIIANLHDKIPCLQNLSGVGRTMPTSRAVDVVAKAKGMGYYETPTGWKFFANLLDDNRIQLCGEESFGTGGNHVREKDGLWTVLCWLSLLAATKMSADEILLNHWQTYGRHHFNRFDYTELDATIASKMIDDFQAHMQDKVGTTISGMPLTYVGQFNYQDPTNGEKSPRQGLQLQFGEQARIMCRLSGTDTKGATLRIYCEYWQQAGARSPALEGTTHTLVALAQNLMNISHICGRSQPNNIV